MRKTWHEIHISWISILIFVRSLCCLTMDSSVDVQQRFHASSVEYSIRSTLVPCVLWRHGPASCVTTYGSLISISLFKMSSNSWQQASSHSLWTDGACHTCIIVLPMLHNHLCLLHTFLTSRTAGGAWDLQTKQCSFGCRGTWDMKVLARCFLQAYTCTQLVQS